MTVSEAAPPSVIRTGMATFGGAVEAGTEMAR